MPPTINPFSARTNVSVQGNGAYGAAVFDGAVDAAVDDRLRHEGARRVVDEHEVGRAGERGERFERVFYGVGARRAARNEQHVRDVRKQLFRRLPVRVAHAHGEPRNARVARKSGGGAVQNAFAPDRAEQFVFGKSRARTRSRGGEYGVR